MGAFFKAFWGRLGRNAGNRVSNAIFGDKWSTPYRVAVDRDDVPRRKRRSGSSSQQSRRQRASATSSGSSRKSNVLAWLLGIALFCGTYNAIINPNKEDIVLLVMLWIVTIGWLFIKRYRANETDS